ncbi:MAG TPA: glycosyltransferase family 4 protein [Polyangia bacterium]
MNLDANAAVTTTPSSTPPVPSVSEKRLRVLILTKVFPSALEPVAAAFNRQQFAALARFADIELLAPVPWFPGAAASGPRTGAGKLARLPSFEWIDGLFVRHPRVFHLPRIDYTVAAGLYVASLFPLVRRLRDRFDVILGSFVYPDGIAATWMGRLLGIPSVVYALGSDINVAPKIFGVPAQLRRTLPRASRIIAVSRDLADKSIALGAPPERTVVVPNGVDRRLFFPRDRAAARATLGLASDAHLVVYVGRVEPAKGIPELLTAFETIAAADPKAALAIVGGGSLKDRCAQAAAAFPGRVHVAGPRPLEEVSTWVAASDLVTLPSHNEGTPNVVLEALAGGRRVVATNVGGIPDLITTPALGELVPPRDPDALAAALLRVLKEPGDAAAISAAGPVTWDESARILAEVLRAAIADPAP